jgi:hypothetical protein
VAVMFFIDENVVRIKQSSLEKVAKLIDATNPPQVDDRSFIEIKDICTVTAKDKKWKTIHHLGAE